MDFESGGEETSNSARLGKEMFELIEVGRIAPKRGVPVCGWKVLNELLVHSNSVLPELCTLKLGKLAVLSEGADGAAKPVPISEAASDSQNHRFNQ